MYSIEATGLGKAYVQYNHQFHRFLSWFGLDIASKISVRVIDNISIHIEQGESVGIMGVNGAGKSTLLKLIAGTLYPSEGSLQVNGDVSAILELGLGFSPELSGRDNIYSTASLMGMSIPEINSRFQWIKEFSELGSHIDEPLRTYSSGMQMRLAFSIATAAKPDILIVDEALAVGDAHFQHKCIKRIKSFRDQGTTLLFVSHDANTVLELCDRIILLGDGKLIRDGNARDVIDYYNAIIAEKDGVKVSVTAHVTGRDQVISGTGEAIVEEINILNENGDQIENVKVGQKVAMRIKVKINSPIPRLVLGYMIKDRTGRVIFGTNTHHTKQALTDLRGGEEIVYHVCFVANYGPGSYSVSTALVSTDTHLVNNYEWRDLASIFNVVNTSELHFAGVSWTPPEIDIERESQ